MENKMQEELAEIIEQQFAKEPDAFLPDNFDEKLIKKVRLKYLLDQVLKEFVIYCILFGLFVAGSMGIIYYVNAGLWATLIRFIEDQSFIFFGVSGLLLYILFVDKVLLRYFYLRGRKI